MYYRSLIWKVKERCGPFTEKNYGFNPCGTTEMDTFTLFRNSLEKQGTRFREVFPTEKRVAIVFRISHQRYSMKKDLRPAVLLKKRLWHRCFPVNFAKFLRRPFLQNTSGQLFLCFMALSDWEFLPQLFKNICFWKIDCGKHCCLSKYFIKFPRASSETAKGAATFKETTNCKISQAVSAIWAPESNFS